MGEKGIDVRCATYDLSFAIYGLLIWGLLIVDLLIFDFRLLIFDF